MTWSPHIKQHFYPRPPGGGRPHSAAMSSPPMPISIHALRVEGDARASSSSRKIPGFLSTPSGWRATIYHLLAHKVNFDFYPRPPGGGRRSCGCCCRPVPRISIHALRVEGDLHTLRKLGCLFCISIHALRVEGDIQVAQAVTDTKIISIHALRVEGDSKNGQSFRLFLRKREKNLPL